MSKQAYALFCSLLFGGTLLLAACSSQQHSPTIPQVSAWLDSELPLGATKAQAIGFFKRHAIESDNEVKGVAGYGLRVMIGQLPTSRMRTPFVRCAIEVALTFDRRLRVSTRQVKDLCSR